MNALFKSRTEKSVGNVNITIELLPDGGYRQYEYHLGDRYTIKKSYSSDWPVISEKYFATSYWSIEIIIITV